MDALLGPDDEVFKKIQKELGEDPGRFTNNLRLLEEWMSCQPHLPQNYDKRMLPIYLRGCKHDMEKTKKKLEVYFVTKSAIPEIFDNRDPERKDIQESLDIVDLAVIPKLTPDGHRITYNKVKLNDSTKFKIDLMMCRGSMNACIRTVKEHPIAGDILVYDAGCLTASHAASILTPTVRKGLTHGPSAYPNRLRQIHLINVPSYLERVIAIIKTMLKEKLRDRFHFHSNPDTLKNYLPDYCIPNDYGGTAGSLEELSRKTHAFAIQHADWLKNQENVKLIGPIPEKYDYSEMGAGTAGSFRKLAID